MVLSVTHTLLAINCGGEEEPSFAAGRNGVLYMGKIQKDWVKEKLILWTFWGKCSSVAQLCQLRHQVSPGICSPQHLLTPRQLWLCLCGCPAGHLHIHIFTVTPAPHENAAVLWERAGNNCSPVLLRGGKYWPLNDESLVTQRVCLVLHSRIAVVLLKHWTTGWEDAQCVADNS